MANIFPIDRMFRITPDVDGKFAVLGDAANGRVGAWSIDFNPDASFTGSFAIVGRSRGAPAHTDSVPFKQVLFRRIYLNGVAYAYDWSAAADVVTGPSLIQVPANGVSIALLISCAAGFGKVYSWPLVGSGAV